MKRCDLNPAPPLGHSSPSHVLPGSGAGTVSVAHPVQHGSELLTQHRACSSSRHPGLNVLRVQSECRIATDFPRHPRAPLMSQNAHPGLIPNSRIALPTTLLAAPVLPCSGNWMRVISILHAHPGHPLRDAVELLTSVARPRIARSEDSPSRVALLCIVANCSDAEVRGGVGIFLPCGGGICGPSGEV